MGKIRRELGDRQAGPEVLEQRPTKGFESEPAYRQQQVGLSVNDPEFKIRPDVMAPHHILGIKDLASWFAGSESDNARLRADLLEGGDQPGNAPGNYTGLFDGILSIAGKKFGMQSTDHKDVHKGDSGADSILKKLGISINRKDRTLDTYNGVPIKDLPYELKRSLLLQYAFEANKQVAAVQQDRVATAQNYFSGETYQQRKDRLLKNPTSVANIPRQVGSFIKILNGSVSTKLQPPKPEPVKSFPNRLIGKPKTKTTPVVKNSGGSMTFYNPQSEFVPTPGVGTLQGGGYRVDLDPVGLGPGGSIMLP